MVPYKKAALFLRKNAKRMKLSTNRKAKHSGRLFMYALPIWTLLLVGSSSYCQNNRFEFAGLAENFFSGKLCSADFKDSTVFLTLDTVNMFDLFAETNFLETDKPNQIIREFKKFMASFKHDNVVYHYGEILKSPFRDGRNFLYGFIDADTNTYRLSLWMDKKNPCLVEGMVVNKYPNKIERGGHMIYLRP